MKFLPATAGSSPRAFCIGATRRSRSPHAVPCGLLPPEGAFLFWGGPAKERPPTLRLRLAAPLGGFFVLGRPGDKNIPRI